MQDREVPGTRVVYFAGVQSRLAVAGIMKLLDLARDLVGEAAKVQGGYSRMME